MFRPLPIFVGLRYTRAKRKNHFVSFISMIAMLGMILGVGVLITVLSVMNGFDRELRERILGMVPHATVNSYGGMKNWKTVIEVAKQKTEVLAAAPYVQGQGMLTSRGRVQGVMVTGIVPDYEQQVSIIHEHMVEGSLQALKTTRFGIVLGASLGNILNVDIGDKVTLVLPEASASPAGVLPRLKRFTVVGFFKVGAELDSSLAVTHAIDASKVFRLNGAVSGVRLKLTDLFAARFIAHEVARSLPAGEYWVSDWTYSHGNLFQAIKLEKTMIGLLLMMIVAVAAFNIVSTLVMVVTDKQADIAILRTMGASSKQVMAIFMVQGMTIGVIGTVLGTILGVIGALTVSDLIAFIESSLGVQFLSADVYFISYLPSELLWSDVAVISISSFTLGFIATLYPSFRASRINPAEALRYE